MSTATTQSTKQAETDIIGEYKTLGPCQSFNGDEIIVMRCAETIDEIFPNWLELSKLNDDHYIPFDVNTPIELARRPDMRKSYAVDPPLTEMGKVCAKMMAREICDRKTIPSVIFCSPDFASIETASLIQRYIGSKCGRIRIEPELSTMYQSSSAFFDKATLKLLGFNIDTDSQPLQPTSDKTTVRDFQKRIKRAFYELTANIKNALIIVDPLSMRFISTLFYPILLKTDRSVEFERARAKYSCKSLSNFAVFKEGDAGMKLYDLSNVTLRSLTFTGFSNDMIMQ